MHPARSIGRRRLTLLAAALTLAVAVTAAPATAATLAPAAKQVLTVNVGALASTTDPSKVTTDADAVLQNAIFAPLYRSPGGADGRLVPVLATRLPVISNGGRSYTVQLRAATWSDGTPITAADVKLAYTRGRSSYLGRRFEPVRAVTVVNARTVRFELRGAVPWFDQLLATSVVTPVPSHAIKRFGSRWTQPARLVTSGPFRLELTRGAYEMQLVPNPKWWGARSVRLSRLVLRAIPPASASSLFDAGRVDATLRDTSILPSQLARRSTDKRFRTVTGTDTLLLHLNTATPDLANAAVRRGIALAIDRAALTQVSSGGIDRPLATLVPAGARGSAQLAPASGTLLSGSGAADPERARQELAAGGWVPSRTLELYTSGEDPLLHDVAAALHAQLAAVGVRVNLHEVAEAELAKVGVGVSPLRSDVELLLQRARPELSDPHDLHQQFTCAAVAAGTNPSGHCSDAYDSALAAAATFAPFAARLAGYRTLQEQLVGPSTAMPVVPLYEHVGTYLVQPWVHGFVHPASGIIDFERVALLVH